MGGNENFRYMFLKFPLATSDQKISLWRHTNSNHVTFKDAVLDPPPINLAIFKIVSRENNTSDFPKILQECLQP